jgi:hypothetical protein
MFEIKKDKTHKKFPSHHINMIKFFLSIQTIIPKPLILPTYTKVLLLSIQKTMLCPGFFTHSERISQQSLLQQQNYLNEPGF